MWPVVGAQSLRYLGLVDQLRGSNSPKTPGAEGMQRATVWQTNAGVDKGGRPLRLVRYSY